MTDAASDRERRWKIVVAFALVYFVWGSTYLAIRVGVLSLPPALFAGLRFVSAGVLLIAYARLTGQRWARGAREWHTIIVVGVLLLVGANGLVVWGEQWVASNIAALIVATTALWIAGLGTLGAHGQALARGAVCGLALGFVGVALLLKPADGFVAEQLHGQLAILVASFSWAAGSIYAKRRHPTTAPLMSAGLQSLVAGVILCTIGVALGEVERWRWSLEGVTALLYLIVFGSCVAYAAYVWLLHTVTPAALGTYAYVNPVVAVILGAWLLDERLEPIQYLGMAVVLVGVALVTMSRARPAPPN